MPRTITQSILAGSLYSVFVISANAATPLMKKADTNQNGLIELTEYTAFAQERFILMDADKDGLVTVDERRAFLKVKREKRAQKRFSKTDTNQDDLLSREEVATAREDRKQRRKNRSAKRRDDQPRIRPDSNKDGVLDAEEFGAFTRARFERLDADGNGVLDRNERKLAKRHPRKKHRGLGR